jgi:hypothetical protein
MDSDESGFIRVDLWKVRALEPFNFVELSEAITGLSVELR